MKRLFAIGLSLLMLAGFSADAVEVSDCALQRYADWKYAIGFPGYPHFGRKWDAKLCGVLAVAPDI